MKGERKVPTFIMVVGLPGAGKSYFVDGVEFSDYNIHSSDSIRKELLGNESDQTNNDLVFKTLHDRVKTDLKNGKSCIYDAVNNNHKRRRAFLQELKNIPCIKKCYVIATPVELCVINDSLRERKVGKQVIDKFCRNFSIPTKREGWDSIDIVYNFESRGYYNTKDLLETLCTLDQHNPHHTLTIGDHCKQCYENVKNDNRFQELPPIDKDILLAAALYHDIGKKDTATFYNKKGEKSDVCHYYEHESVGSYKVLFLSSMLDFSKDEILEISDLIGLHMRLYSNPDSTKYKPKLKRQLGDRTFNLIEILNDADRSAK